MGHGAAVILSKASRETVVAQHRLHWTANPGKVCWLHLFLPWPLPPGKRTEDPHHGVCLHGIAVQVGLGRVGRLPCSISRRGLELQTGHSVCAWKQDWPDPQVSLLQKFPPAETKTAIRLAMASGHECHAGLSHRCVILTESANAPPREHTMNSPCTPQ